MREIRARWTNHLTRVVGGVLATVGAALAAIPGSEALVVQFDEVMRRRATR